MDAAQTAYIIVVARSDNPELQYRAITMGAQGWVSKFDSEQTLVMAIRKVHEGEVWINRSMVAYALNSLRYPAQVMNETAYSIASLTPREREVIHLIAEGMRNSDIAAELHISESTVGHHLSSIYSKLAVTDRLELAIFAFRHRLADLPQ
jgi:DNA-binding NarL/FixJ family response regulator